MEEKGVILMVNNENAVVQTTVVAVKEKKKLISILACLLGGYVGLHKFYEEKYLMGILYVVTLGGFAVGMIIDLIVLLRKPSVYKVEKKRYHFKPENIQYTLLKIKTAILSFPLNKVGKVISGVGGGIAGLGCGMGFNLLVIVPGLLVAVLGMVLSWLHSRDLVGTLKANGIIMGIAAVGLFAIAFLIGAVLLWVILKFTMGIDIFEWLFDLFGDGDKADRRDTDIASPKPYAFPQYIYVGSDQYRLEHSSGDHAQYICDANGNRKTVWKYDLETD